MFSRKTLAACIPVLLLSVVLPCETFSDGDTQDKQPTTIKPPFQVVDVKLSETRKVELSDGSTAEVRLLKVESTRNSVLDMICESRATVQVNGESVTLGSGNYNLPVAVGGVQIDCPVTGDYPGEKVREFWHLAGDARLRIWPGGSPWITPGTFTYPVRQRWMGAMTWFSNEPVSRVNDWCYYHAGMDFGGTEGMTEVVSAIDGVVASSGLDVMPGCEPPVEKRADVVYLKDRRGWFYRYSHLKEIDPAMKVGAKVKQGQRVGLIGKEGHSGGWTHLHFDIRALQPSGKWGVQDSYAFLWQTYRDQYDPKVIAVARPAYQIKAGDTVTLDAGKSWAESGVKSYEWRLSDGTTAEGPTVKRVYDRPGTYSEVVKVTDNDGRIDYDFAQVRVFDPETGKLPLGIDANYHPSLDIQPGNEITFSCRGFRDGPSRDTWDFGDGTPPVTVTSNLHNSQHAPKGYAFTKHSFARAGDYIVTVSTSDEAGHTTTRRLHVHVGN